MGDVVIFPARTYAAKPHYGAEFQMSGTLDGFIDFATDCGTYVLSLDEARAVVAALNGAIDDVTTNCLYDRDVLLDVR